MLVAIVGEMKAVASSIIYSDFSKSVWSLLNMFSPQQHRFDQVENYEEAFAEMEGSPYAAATSMARIGLYQVLKSLNIKPGSAIALSPVNIPEMLAVIESLQLKPVFVDFAPHSLFVDLRELENQIINSNAKVLFLTYIAGQIGDLQAVKNICERYSVTWIQDATQANGCQFHNHPLAQWADYTLFSTCEFKYIHTYRGAMICTNDFENHVAVKKQIESIRGSQHWDYRLAKWGIDSLAAAVLNPKLFAAFFYRLARRLFIQDPLGDFTQPPRGLSAAFFLPSEYIQMRRRIPRRMFFRLSNFEAWLGLRDLQKLPERVQKHREIAQKYLRSFRERGVLPTQNPHTESSYWRFPILLANENQTQNFIQKMRQKKIFVERSGLSVLSKDCRQASRAMANLVFIPCHQGISDRDADNIAAIANQYLLESRT